MQTGMCLMRNSRRGVGNLRMGEKTRGQKKSAALCLL